MQQARTQPTDSLAALGWNDRLQRDWDHMAPDQVAPARVIADYGSSYKVALPKELYAEASGRLQYFLALSEMPKIGDWVGVQVLDESHGIIHTVLPRSSEISRKQPGGQAEKQVLAANVDLAFLVQALDHDFSPERLRRYLFQLSRAGVEPILVLNKADKQSDIEDKLQALKPFNIRIIISSALLHNGIDEIAAAITPGSTAVFLGSSGVGKSTLTNALLGIEAQATQAIREADSKGRHTTTHRELFVLPNGGLIIDTPGLRELQLWGTEEDLEGVFSDIEALAAACKFSNCSHTNEPECAVLQAVQQGSLDADRLESYFKLQKELRYLHTKIDEASAHERRQHHKKSQKHYNQVIRGKQARKGA